MGISIISNSGKQSYGIKHFVVDTQDDINKLTNDCAPGSTAYVVSTSKSYMLNTKKEWTQINDNNFIF